MSAISPAAEAGFPPAGGRRAADFLLAACLLVATLATALATPHAAARAAADRPAQARIDDGAAALAALERYPEARVVLRHAGREHVFRAWIADTPERRERGLMYVRSLEPDRGMLFVFDAPQVASFWMKNTYVSLDLLFIAADGRVLRIAENAKPHSLDLIASMGPVIAVLELKGGTARRLGLGTGATVRVERAAGAPPPPAAGYDPRASARTAPPRTPPAPSERRQHQ